MKLSVSSSLQTAHYKSNNSDKTPRDSSIVKKVIAGIFLASIGILSIYLSFTFRASAITLALISTTILSTILIASYFFLNDSKTQIIENHPIHKQCPSTFQALPQDSIQQILDLLQLKDQFRVAQVNKASNHQVKKATIRRAIEYGCKVDDFASAHQYLATLFYDMAILLKASLIPKNYIIRKGQKPLFRHIDLEATIQVIFNLKDERQVALQQHLSHALFEYSHARNVKVVQALLRQGANPNILNSSGLTPLIARYDTTMFAHWIHGTDTKDDEIIELLSRNGADLNYQDHDGYTALHFAASLNEVRIVKALLKYGANPNAIMTNRNDTPLMRTENTEIISLLLKYGADPNIANYFGFTPLFALFNSTKEHAETVRLLCTKGANVNQQIHPHGYTMLHFAAHRGNVERVKMLLKYGANLTIVDNQGNTPLMFSKNKAIASLLLAHGGDPNIANHDGVTAVFSENDAFLEVICKHGANTNHQTNNGYTALHFAASREKIERVKILLKYGADPTIVDNQGRTPLMLTKNKEIIALLSNKIV